MRVLLIDLDETLYPRGNGVLGRVRTRINTYLRDRLGVAPDEVDALRRTLRDSHGTTLRGLEARGDVDVEDYLAFVHGVDLSDLLAPEPALRALLARLPERKLVFTNAPRSHAEQVLRLLDVRDAFEDVICLEDLAFRPKPEACAFTVALGRARAAAGDCCLVDDTRGHVLAARRQGLHGVWVTDDPSPDPELEHRVRDLAALDGCLARLRR